MKKIFGTVFLVFTVFLAIGCTTSTSSSTNENNSAIVGNDKKDKETERLSQLGNRTVVINQEDYNVSNADLTTLITEGLKNRLELELSSSDKLKLDFPYYEDDILFATFYADIDNEKQIGFFTAQYREEKYHLEDLDIFPADLTKPFDVTAFIGKIGEHRSYKAIFGHVNNGKITEIQTHYTDGTINVIKMKPENQTFLDVITGRGVTEQLVEGFDEKGSLVYQKSY